MKEYVITLVHGTWAREARWTVEGSLFRTALQERLRPASVRFSNFIWSGKNDLFARRQAAAALLRHLRRLLSTYPASRHYVISHSHGGNISFLAFRLLQQRLGGLACLSTPFLHVQPRNFPAGTDETFVVGVGLWAFLVFLLSLHLLNVPNPILFTMDSRPVSLHFASASMLALIVMGVLTYALRVWETSIPRALRRFRLPDVRNDRVLIIRAAGDEATAVLAGARLWSWFLSKAVTFGARLDARGLDWKVLLKWGIGGFGLLLAGAWVSDETRRQWPLLIGLIGFFAGFVLACAPVFAVAFVAPTFLLLAFIMRLAYGRGAALFAASLEMTAEATPEGNWHSVTVDTGADFAHSSYENPAVRSLVADWLIRQEPGVDTTL